MTRVTKESLAVRIAHLERVRDEFGLAISQEYTLSAYKMLRDLLQNEDSKDAAEEDFDV